jgi:hypothetical protein
MSSRVSLAAVCVVMVCVAAAGAAPLSSSSSSAPHSGTPHYGAFPTTTTAAAGPAAAYPSLAVRLCGRPGTADDCAQHAFASGSFRDDSVNSGWGYLLVAGAASPIAPSDAAQAYAMGFLEGFLTQQRIYQAKTNLFTDYFGTGGAPSGQLAAFFSAQLAFVRNGVASYADSNTYWARMAVIMAQFDGLLAGYNAAAPSGQAVAELDLYVHNSAGDLEDLSSVFCAPGECNAAASFAERARQGMLDCSSLVRVLPNGDILAGHTTWRQFVNMAPRIYKRYQYELEAAEVVNQDVVFSSTPGFLSSKVTGCLHQRRILGENAHMCVRPVSQDDFYLCVDTQLTVMETTNAIFNRTLYSYLSPQTLFTWQRTMIANFLATTGNLWTYNFARFNSGTYNNQCAS